MCRLALLSGLAAALVATRFEDRGLRYADWVRRNREYVAEKTDDGLPHG